MEKNKDNAFANIILYNAKHNPLRNDSAKAGYFLLANGMLSSQPFNHLETGIMVTDTLYVPFGFSKEPCTRTQALEFYKMLNKKVPTYFQSLLFYQVIPKINNAMASIGKEDYIFPIIPDSIWDENNLAKADDKEKHRCVVFESTQPLSEIKCVPVASELLIINNTQLMQRQQLSFEPAPLKLLARCKGIDFLITRTWLSFHLLYRDSKQRLHYLGSKRTLRFINNELIVVNDTLYQNYKGKLIAITPFNSHSSFVGYEGDMPVIREAVHTAQDQIIENNFYYKKDADGIFRFDHSSTV